MEINYDSSLYSIANLKSMEVIDINSGSRLGYIKDFVIDCEEFKISSMIIPTQKMSWFNKDEVLEIPWEKVHKIGIDVILVDGDDIIDDKE